MSKPTYEELAEALRYFVGQGCLNTDYYTDYRKDRCTCCGGYLGEPSPDKPLPKHVPITLGHESYCDFAKAEALLKRIDAKEPV